MSVILECPKCLKQYPLKEAEASPKKYICKACRTELRPINNPIQAQKTKTGAYQALLEDAPDDVKTAFKSEKAVIAGKYLLGRKIGQGGMGAIYKGWDTVLKRYVAVKMILHSMLDTSTKHGTKDTALNRFALEAQTAAKLLHPNILQVFDVGKHGEDYFIIMEFVDGCNLDEYFEDRHSTDRHPSGTGKHRGNLPSKKDISEYLNLMIKIIRAIDYAHKSNIIHRDIKPANILLAKDNNDTIIPKVSDFGLAKEVTSKKNLTVEGTVVGTPVYMSPEQAVAAKLDARSDIFSLGSVLYKLCTSIDPFRGKSSLDVMKAVVNKDPIAPSIINKAINKDIETIILKAIEKDKERRYASAEEMADDIEKSLNGEPIKARPASMAYKAIKTFRRNKISFIGIGIAAAILVTVLSYMWINAMNRNESAQELLDTADRFYNEMNWADANSYYNKYLTLVNEDSAAEERMEECQAMLQREEDDKKLLAAEKERQNRLLEKQNRALSQTSENEKQASEEAQTAWLYANQMFMEFYKENANMEKAWKQIAEAETMLDNSLKKCPTAMAFFYRAMIRKEKIMLNEAIDDLTKAVELKPDFDIAYIMRGILYFEMARDNSLMGMEYGTIPGIKELANEYAQKASADFNRINSDNKIPEQYEAYREIFEAMQFLYKMQIDQCISTLEAAYEKYGHDEILYWLAVNYAMKNAAKAEELADAVIEMKAQHAKAYYLKGVLVDGENDVDDAIENYTSAIRINPFYARAFSARACAYIRKGELDSAISDFTRAIELCPGDCRYYSKRGTAYSEKKNYLDAMEDFTKAILINPRFTEAWVNRGLAYYKTGSLQKAVNDYTTALSVDPKDVNAYSNRAIAKYDMNDYNGALNDYNAIIQVTPGEPMTYGNRGYLLYKAGKLKEALADFEKFSEMKPDMADQVKAFMDDIRKRLSE